MKIWAPLRGSKRKPWWGSGQKTPRPSISMALPVARARATMRARRMQASQDSARDSDTALAFLAFKSNFTVGAGEESAESGKAGFFALAHANEDFADYEVEAVGGLSLGASGLAGHFLNDF